jgi:hypothetical protein
MLIYTHSRSKRKKPSDKSVQLREDRKQMFASVLKGRKPKFINNMSDLTVENTNVAPLSDAIPANGYKRSVDDWKWKRDRVESAETVKEIERKKTRIAPLWNKGSTQYITDGADPTTIGRKI